jgi:hypothetical protein
MKTSVILAAGMLSAAMIMAGCDRNETPIGNAVEGTKDALDMREHEKLKDAAEDTQDAFENMAEGIKDEMRAN